MSQERLHRDFYQPCIIAASVVHSHKLQGMLWAHIEAEMSLEVQKCIVMTHLTPASGHAKLNLSKQQTVKESTRYIIRKMLLGIDPEYWQNI